MKNTLNQSIVSNPIPAAISSQHAGYLIFFIENRCEIAALKKQFALTPLQIVEFLTAKTVRAAIEEMHETIRASLAVAALKARDFAMDKLKIVCNDLIRQTTITAGTPINEPAHAKAINHLRLATSQLGRFAAAAIAPPKTPRKTSVRTDQIDDQNPPYFATLPDLRAALLYAQNLVTGNGASNHVQTQATAKTQTPAEYEAIARVPGILSQTQ